MVLIIARGYWDKQITWIRRAIRSFHEMSQEEQAVYRWKIVMLYNSICWVHALRGQFEIARKEAEEAVRLSAESNDEHGRAIAFRQLGYILASLGYLEKASECYLTALSIWKRTQNARQIAALYFNMGELAVRKREFAEAERYYRDSIEAMRELGDWSRLGEALRRMGELLLTLNKPGVAEKFLRERDL